jgi:hypothetical protein
MEKKKYQWYKEVKKYPVEQENCQKKEEEFDI